MPEIRDVTVQGPAKIPERGINAKIGVPGSFDALTADKMGSIFANIFRDADDYRKRFTAAQLKCYTQYNGESDDRFKAEWQSRAHLAYPKQVVDVAAARIMNALVQNENFFDIRPNRRGEDEKANSAKRIIKWNLWKSNFREQLKIAVKNGLICGFGPLFYTYDERLISRTVVQAMPATTMIEGPAGDQVPVTVMTNQMVDQPMLERCLRFEAPLPIDVWKDPSGRNRFIIKHFRRSVADLEAMAQPETDPTTGTVLRGPIYDIGLLQKVTPGMADQEQEVNAAIMRRDTPYIAKDVSVDVYEYYGDFYDPQTGATLFRNSLITFVNKRYMIRPPEANPYRHGQIPMVDICPMLAPFQIYGQGLLEPAIKVADEIDRILNVILDKARLSVPTTEVFPSSFRNPSDSAQAMQGKMKFFPGKMLIGKDPEKPMMRAVEGFQPPSEIDMAMLQFLIQTYQNLTGVNEWATGSPQTSGRKTRSEVQLRAGATEQVFNDSATHIEEFALSPLLKNIYLLIIQFVDDYSDEVLLKSFGDDERGVAFIQALKNLSPEDRWKAMYFDAEFRVNAISLQITKQDQLTKTINFLQSISQNPQLMAVISWRGVLGKLIDYLDQDRDILLSQEDAILQAFQAAQVQQLFNPQPQPNDFNNKEQAASSQKQAAEKAQGGPPPEQ